MLPEMCAIEIERANTDAVTRGGGIRWHDRCAGRNGFQQVTVTDGRNALSADGVGFVVVRDPARFRRTVGFRFAFLARSGVNRGRKGGSE